MNGKSLTENKKYYLQNIHTCILISLVEVSEGKRKIRHNTLCLVSGYACINCKDDEDDVDDIRHGEWRQ